MTDSLAVVQTAVATWALVLGSIAACAATIYAVWTTLNQERQAEERRNLLVSSAALSMVEKSVNKFRELKDAQGSTDPIITEGRIWQQLGELSALRRVSQGYLNNPILDPDLPLMLSEMIQRSFDAKAAMEMMLPRERGKDGLPASLSTLESVEIRMKGIDTRISEARQRLTQPDTGNGNYGRNIFVFAIVLALVALGVGLSFRPEPVHGNHFQFIFNAGYIYRFDEGGGGIVVCSPTACKTIAPPSR